VDLAELASTHQHYFRNWLAKNGNNVKSLSFTTYPNTPQHSRFLPGLQQLRSLELFHVSAETVAAMQPAVSGTYTVLSALTNLTSLSIMGDFHPIPPGLLCSLLQPLSATLQQLHLCPYGSCLAHSSVVEASSIVSNPWDLKTLGHLAATLQALTQLHLEDWITCTTLVAMMPSFSSRLQDLQIGGILQFSNARLQQLANLLPLSAVSFHLETLEEVQEVAMWLLQGGGQNLKQLALHLNRRVTATDSWVSLLPHLALLPKLSRLSLTYNYITSSSASQLSELQRLTKVTELELSGLDLPPSCIPPNLAALVLAPHDWTACSCWIGKEDQYISSLKQNLTRLEFDHRGQSCSISNHLDQLLHLQELRMLTWQAVPADQLLTLSSLSQLSRLQLSSLGNGEVGEDWIHALAQVSSLQCLQLDNFPLYSAAGMALAASLTHLTSLNHRKPSKVGENCNNAVCPFVRPERATS
jgi:hypothetical protein